MKNQTVDARQPVLFIGHGSPTTILSDNKATRNWAKLGKSLAKPKSILMISAHWYTRGTAVTAMPTPKTIHDFGPLSPDLFKMQYPAPGNPALARRVKDLLAPEVDVALDKSWGFDHGTWTILKKIFPEADVPVVQLSLDEHLAGAGHFKIGQKLQALRDEGILIIASGNIVHNMGRLIWKDNAPTYPWGERFRDYVLKHTKKREFEPLIEYMGGGADALQSVPYPDHYFPLMYALAATDQNDRLTVENDFFQLGSIGMTSMVFRPSH